jgi:hypothetical protein
MIGLVDAARGKRAHERDDVRHFGIGEAHEAHRRHPHHAATVRAHALADDPRNVLVRIPPGFAREIRRVVATVQPAVVFEQPAAEILAVTVGAAGQVCQMPAPRHGVGSRRDRHRHASDRVASIEHSLIREIDVRAKSQRCDDHDNDGARAPLLHIRQGALSGHPTAIPRRTVRDSAGIPGHAPSAHPRWADVAAQ